MILRPWDTLPRPVDHLISVKHSVLSVTGDKFQRCTNRPNRTSQGKKQDLMSVGCRLEHFYSSEQTLYLKRCFSGIIFKPHNLLNPLNCWKSAFQSYWFKIQCGDLHRQTTNTVPLSNRISTNCNDSSQWAVWKWNRTIVQSIWANNHMTHNRNNIIFYHFCPRQFIVLFATHYCEKSKHKLLAE